MEGNGCPVKGSPGNQLPRWRQAPTHHPQGYPFGLTAVGSDPDSDILTYTWEQFDNDVADMPPSPANNDGPFKSVLPDTIPVRIFPAPGNHPQQHQFDLRSPARRWAGDELPDDGAASHPADMDWFAAGCR